MRKTVRLFNNNMRHDLKLYSYKGGGQEKVNSRRSRLVSDWLWTRKGNPVESLDAKV